MPLAKASIEPIRPRGDKIELLFNPTQYSLDASNQIAEIGVPGLRAPVLQFVRGGGRTLSLDVFLDAYEQRDLGGRSIDDVTDLAESVYGLLTPTAETGAPPVCVFAWKDRRLQCVLERVSGRFTVFRADGAPLRATLSVSLREYVDAAVVVRRGAAALGEAGSTHVVQRGDTLFAIAQKSYGNGNRWREIASANGIANPRKLEPGTVLVIPPAGGGGG
jgi:nucleoid-associated protein YgaU